MAVWYDFAVEPLIHCQSLICLCYNMKTMTLYSSAPPLSQDPPLKVRQYDSFRVIQISDAHFTAVM